MPDGAKAAPKPLRRMLLKPREVCQLTGLGKSTIYELMAAGVIPCVRIGRCVRYPQTDCGSGSNSCRAEKRRGENRQKLLQKAGSRQISFGFVNLFCSHFEGL